MDHRRRAADRLPRTLLGAFLCGAAALALARPAAADWPGFRGPGSLGQSGERGLPVKWSDTENIVWKARLPGPGSSGPVTHGNKVFLTCYTGYGTGQGS